MDQAPRKLELDAEQEAALRERLEADGLITADEGGDHQPGQGEGAEYRVVLDAYAGPLDLLLYLVKRHEIDLADIPMARLAEQYLKHIEVIQQFDIDRAGEFLVMAATLLEIKSKLIIPPALKPEGEEDEDATQDIEVPEDPRLALVQQLLAYKKFKDAAWHLEARGAEWEDRFEAHARRSKPVIDASQAPQLELDIGDLSVFDLHGAFQRMMESVGYQGDHQVQYDDTPIALHAEDIADLLVRRATEDAQVASAGMSLREIFTGRKNRSEMIGLFLATLELLRDHRIRLRLADGGAPGNPDDLFYIPTSEAEQAADKAQTDSHDTWADPETGEIQYEWPDEEARIRAERRERLRQTLAAKAEAEARGETFDLNAYHRQRRAGAAGQGDLLEDLDEDALAEEQDYADSPLEEDPDDAAMPDVD